MVLKQSNICGIGDKMPETNSNEQNEFIIEKIKTRPVNKKKLIRRTIITAAMAVIFGLVACFTFLLLEPLISNWLYPAKDPVIVTFPEDLEEISPEDMLTDNMLQENQANQQNANLLEALSLNNQQIQSILDSVVIDKDNMKEAYDSLISYSNELKKSIVTIIGVTSNIDWMNNLELSKVRTYGVVIANNGRELLILADYNPLKKAEFFTLTFNNGLQVSAEVKEVNSKTNLAVLSVNLEDVDSEMIGTEITIAQLGSSNAKYVVGTPVLALGSPLGMANSFNYGMVVSVSTLTSLADSSFKLLQTNMIGSDNAEGILFNFNGQVIGIITNNESGIENTITAYGITELKRCIEKMSNGSKIPYIGIKGLDVTAEANSELGVPYGGYITEVEMDSPAMMAGIKQGDVIIALGERPISSFADYANALIQMNAGGSVKIRVLRQSQNEYKEVEFDIEIQELK